MVREFSDYEFKLYGNVQSFFYRCWKGFGYGQVLDGGRQKLINRESVVSNWVVFSVDISQNLEDYDFYNIKWVFNTEINTKEPSNYTYRQVPKIF